MTDDNLWLVEAGEYVLGTLRGTERDLFEKVLNNDVQARQLVDFWERQFGTLETVLQREENLQSVSADVWEKISAKIDEEQLNPSPQGVPFGAVPTRIVGDDANGSANHAANNSPGASTTGGTQQFPSTQQRTNPSVAPQGAHGPPLPQVISLRRWRGLASLSLAASLIMGSFIVHQNVVKQSGLPTTQNPDATVAGSGEIVGSEQGATGYNVVSILRDEAGNDLWAILAETDSGRIRAVALPAAQPLVAQSHQLWVVLPDDQGVQSVGILPYGDGSVGEFELQLQTERDMLDQGAAFAVSLEPEGGTDTAAPTGPVISAQEYTRLSDEI